MKIELEGAEQQVPKMEPVPFAEAIAWAESRGVVLPHVYYGELQGLARAAAFSIAGVAQLDQLQMVLDSLAEWTRDGGTMAEWMRKVESKEINLELPKHRLENIYRTNLQNHFGRGRCEQQARNVNTRPWFLYDAVNDSRTRPSHAAMDGTVARYDDPLWQKWTPPSGYQSLLPDQVVCGAVEIGLKAFYSGPAVEIVMNSGARIRVTSKHPVLTNRGWVDAGDIAKGDSLVCYSGDVGIADGAIPSNGKKQNAPSRIDQTFNSLASNGVVSVPTAAFNLNGDVEFMRGDVDVVAANGVLLDALKAGVLKGIEEFGFKRSDDTQVSELGISTIGSHNLSFLGIGPRFSGNLGGQDGVIPDSVNPESLNSGGGCVWFDPARFQFTGEPFSVDAKFGSNAFKRHSRLVERDSIFRDRIGVPSSGLSHVDGGEKSGLLFLGSLSSSFNDVFIGGFEINPDAFGSLRDAHPGLIDCDEVVDVVPFDYSGHVYDLQCSNGLIVAYGGGQFNPILSNCRCRRISLSDRQAERYIEADRNRLAKYPEIAEARSTAQPDQGWDYSICGDAPPTQPGEVSQATRQAQDGIAPAPMTGIDRAVARKLADPRYPMPMRDELARKHVRAIDEASEEPVLVQEAVKLPGYSLPVDRLAIRYARNTIRHKRITAAQRAAYDALPLEQRQYVDGLIAAGLIG